MGYQASKQLVLDYYQALDQALKQSSRTGVGNQAISLVFKKYYREDFLFRGMHPFYEITEVDELVERFWLPLSNAIMPLQRRMDIFMAGKNEIDGGASEWVCSMGNLMGNFLSPWLNIPSSKKMTFLRYAEFFRIENQRIVEHAFFCDIISVMKQVGLHPLPTATGQEMVTPGPMTHDGLLFDDADESESEKTLALINRMINDINHHGEFSSPKEELSQTWHDDMIWYGPAGIGASYTHEGYVLQHQAPFRKGIVERAFNGHICRFAEGNFGGFFGWSNLSLKFNKNFLGLPGSDKTTEMRVVDIYRRSGEKLAENWVFIDLLHCLYKLDLDILGKLQELQFTDFNQASYA